MTLRGIAKRYPLPDGSAVAALDDVNLHVPGGAIAALTGPSGSGKSTLLHVVGAMDEADAGEIDVADHRVTSLGRKEQTAYRRRIGFVFQRFHLLAAISAADNVAAPLLPYGTAFDPRERARELLHAAGLVDRADSLPPASPAANSSASRSPARSSMTRSCCSRTSRQAISTRRPAARSST